MPVPVSQTPTLTSTLVPKEESTMPFIDDELLWCPDNDGKMVDLTQCLQESTTGQPVEFSAMELSALVGGPAAPNVPSEDGEGMSGVNEEPFDTLDTFLRELQADLAEPSQPTSTTTPTVLYRRQRYNIAAANPLLAEKLAAPAAQLSHASIPFPTRTEIKTEIIHPETSKDIARDVDNHRRMPTTAPFDNNRPSWSVESARPLRHANSVPGKKQPLDSHPHFAATTATTTSSSDREKRERARR